MICLSGRYFLVVLLTAACVLMPCFCRRRRYKRGDECHEDIMSRYEVSFFGDWSRKAFPKMYPRYRPHAQWSKLVGRTHDSTYKLWREGDLASPTLQKFVEEGNARLLERDAQGYNGTLDSFSAAPIKNGVGRSSVRIVANGKFSKLSFIVKIIPSPDWFVGVDSVDLCRAGRWRRRIHMTMRPMDGGTDKGLTYTSPNWPTLPQEPVYQILPTKPRHPASPFYDPDGDKLPRIAHVLIERIGEFTRRGKRKSSKFRNATNVYIPANSPKTTAKTQTTVTVQTTKQTTTEEVDNNSYHLNGYREALPPDFHEVDGLASHSKPTLDTEYIEDVTESDTQTSPLLTQNDDSSAVRYHYPEKKTQSTKNTHGNLDSWTTFPLTSEATEQNVVTDVTQRPKYMTRDSKEHHKSYKSHLYRSTAFDRDQVDEDETTEPTRPDYKARSLFRDEYGQQHGILFEKEKKREEKDAMLVKNDGILDCLVSEWEEWGPCSKTCGFGVRTRNRQIIQQPENGGSACPRVALEALCGSMRTCAWNHFSMFAQRSRRRRHHRVHRRKP